jgi:hypothetical protein
MKPRVAYRLSAVLAPLAALLTLLAALNGAWLPTACAAVACAGGLVNLREARRRGMSWNGPRTFRELREVQARSREASDR